MKPSEPPLSSLINFIKKKHKIYYGKICELRGAIKEWLSYIPNTFPHYTRHTIDHSDEIVLQISKLLFKNNSLSPVVKLSGIEAYILVVSAYLHDAGMVTSDEEKTEIISSEEWRNWISDENNTKRWEDIQRLREDRNQIPDDNIRNFLSDIQLRFLIAEFIRISHHIRAGKVINLHNQQLGHFAFGDHILQKAIADICIGHGLNHYELDDDEKYPEQRDIQGEPVNLRFLAILLRLGDLLDMSLERACSLLLNAASPLPSNSLAHWKQYDRIIHQSTTPNRIEVIAKCESQDEHRVLRDWCQWIVEEVEHAKIIMPRAERHHNWIPPDATINGKKPTIKIEPSETANYEFSNWVIQFDQREIFDRLIENVYENPLTFIRELIQNSLDATRCKLFEDLQNENLDFPDSPTQVDETRRNEYPIIISLETREVKNHLSNRFENKQVLIIEDNGIGMDTEVIEKYFLQIGRSFYNSNEFRQKFDFNPTSRFGIGFLSVFAVSNYILIDTYKPSSQKSETKPIKVTLTGIRSYLLREHGNQQTAGTRIEVLLHEAIKPNRLTELVSNWCKRVEFPIIVNDLGTETTIVAENAEMFTYEETPVTNTEAKLLVKSFPIERRGIEGELYIFATVDERGESWASWGWASHFYPQEHPLAFSPKFPDNLTCFHGITINEANKTNTAPRAERLDYRSNKIRPTISRNSLQFLNDDGREFKQLVESRWEEILSEHLETTAWGSSEDTWLYKQMLIRKFPLEKFWFSMPGTLRVYKGGIPQLFSLEELLKVVKITVLMTPKEESTHKSESEKKGKEIVPIWDNNLITISSADFPYISPEHRKVIFINRKTSSVRWLSTGHLAVDWKLRKEHEEWFYAHKYSLYPIQITELPNYKVVGGCIHQMTEYGSPAILLNKTHKLVQWIENVKAACIQSKYGLKEEQFEQLIAKLETTVTNYGNEYWFNHLMHYIKKWKDIPDLPPDLYPPKINLKPENFVLTP